MHKTSDNCILKKGYFSTCPLLLTEKRKKTKEKKLLYQNVSGSLLYPSPPPHLIMTRRRVSMIVLPLPQWIGYVKEIDEESFSPWAFCFGTASITQLSLQLTVVAGFCLCWVNCGLVLLHSDLFSRSAPTKTWSAAGFIFLLFFHGPSPSSYLAQGP